MKKILNEWKKFLKEAVVEDARTVGSRVLAVIDPKSIPTPESKKYLRTHKLKAIALIRDFLFNGNKQVFSIPDHQKSAKAVGSSRQHYFPDADINSRLEGMLDILEDARSDFDFSQFSEEEKMSRSEIPGKYGMKDHAGGASDTGFAVPKHASADEIQIFVDYMNDYKSSYMYKEEDYVMPSMEYKRSLETLLKAYDMLLGMWNKHEPRGAESEKIEFAIEAAEESFHQDIELTPVEQAHLHMENGKSMYQVGLRESYLEFISAKRIFKKLKMANKVREAQTMYQKARDLK